MQVKYEKEVFVLPLVAKIVWLQSSQVYAEDYASGQSAFWTARQSFSANSIVFYVKWLLLSF